MNPSGRTLGELSFEKWVLQPPRTRKHLFSEGSRTLAGRDIVTSEWAFMSADSMRRPWLETWRPSTTCPTVPHSEPENLSRDWIVGLKPFDKYLRCGYVAEQSRWLLFSGHANFKVLFPALVNEYWGKLNLEGEHPGWMEVIATN